MVRIYRLCLEGSSSSGHFVDEHSQAPNIDFLIICLSFQNLRRNIVQCSTKGISFVFGSISRPSKIGQLRDPLTQQYILRFEISVEDRFGVAILQGLNHLLGVVPDCILIELDSEKLTLFCILAKRHFESAYSRIMQRVLLSRKQPNILRTLGWSMNSCSLIY